MRALWFFPALLSGAVVGILWRIMYNYNNGVINKIITSAGLPAVNWLETRGVTNIAIIIGAAWVQIGLCVVVFLAGLQSISASYYEAAEIDGANAVQRFFNITVPLISPTLFFVVLMRTMNSLKQFDTVYLLIKQTNPAFKKTFTLMVLFYREAFEKFNKGYASAIVMWSFVIIMIFTVFQFVAEKKLVNYD